MKMKLGSLAAIFLLSFFTTTDGYKILAVFAYSSQSHINNFLPIANLLASRSNEITLVSPYSDLKVHPKVHLVTALSIEELYDIQNKHIFNVSTEETPSFTGMAQEICEKTLKSISMTSFLRTTMQFDIVVVNIVLNECALAVSHLLGNHTILYSAGSIPLTIPSPAPIPYSSVPSSFLALPSRMSLIQRIRNFASYAFVKLAVNSYLFPSLEKVLLELEPRAMSMEEAFNNVALYLINTDPVTTPNRPTTPNMVSVTCTQCRQAEPLPNDVEEFINSSGENGFILFSFGSDVQSKNLSLGLKYAFLRAFAQLEQKVIWKIDDDSLQPPPNVYITNRIPQQDLLGHTKIRLMITHGELLSLQEAVYHAVPILGIPLFADQLGTMAHMVDQGLAVKLNLRNITTEIVLNKLKNILEDPRYAERMKSESAIFRDHNTGAVDQGAEWIEYVARYNGIQQLKVIGQEMDVMMYYNLDVVVVLIMLTCISFTIVVKVFKRLWNGSRLTKLKTA